MFECKTCTHKFLEKEKVELCVKKHLKKLKINPGTHFTSEWSIANCYMQLED